MITIQAMYNEWIDKQITELNYWGEAKIAENQSLGNEGEVFEKLKEKKENFTKKHASAKEEAKKYELLIMKKLDDKIYRLDGGNYLVAINCHGDERLISMDEYNDE